jgi:hypothetical protein
MGTAVHNHGSLQSRTFDAIEKAPTETFGVGPAQPICDLSVGKSGDREINHPDRDVEFLSDAERGVGSALSRPSIVYGWHVQSFFAAVVSALDQLKLLEDEDAGSTFSDEDVKIPDWSRLS